MLAALVHVVVLVWLCLLADVWVEASSLFSLVFRYGYACRPCTCCVSCVAMLAFQRLGGGVADSLSFDHLSEVLETWLGISSVL